MPLKSVNRVREILAGGCQVPQVDVSDRSDAADPHMHGEKKANGYNLAERLKTRFWDRTSKTRRSPDK